MELENFLSLAVHAMNYTAGNNGLSPYLLVFRIFTSMPTSSEEYSQRRKRMKALQTARSEMVKAIARQRLAHLLGFNVPTATDRNIVRNQNLLN